MELFSARKTLLQMAQKDVEQLREVMQLPVDDCHQMVSVIADRLAHALQVLEDDNARLEKILESRK